MNLRNKLLLSFLIFIAALVTLVSRVAKSIVSALRRFRGGAVPRGFQKVRDSPVTRPARLPDHAVLSGP
jgi:hypothetical protein